MRFSWLQQVAQGAMWPPVPWLGRSEAIAAGLIVAGAVLVLLAVLPLRRRRRARAALAERLLEDTHALKEQLRFRLAEPAALFADPRTAGPTMGASEGFEGDIEAAARTVLIEAGGHRAKAKDLLRQRINGHGNGGDNGALNGSGVAYWRQLGALSLLDSTGDAAAAYARAADLAPQDAQAQMLSGVLHLRTGNLPAAEAAFRRQLGVSGAEDAGVARYRGQTMLGDVHAARDAHEAAVAAYQEAQREVLALLEHGPEQCALQRDLSVTCDRIGDALAAAGKLDAARESYQQALEIMAALAAREPDNPAWLRDLSVSHDRIGDILQRQGDVEGALESYRQGLACAQSLATREPGNAQAQWELSVSHERVGDMLLAKDQLDEALQSYRRGLAIAETLASRDPAHVGWQRDLAVSYHKIGSLEAARGNAAEARDLLEKGRAIIARLARIAAHQAQWRSDLSKFDQTLQGLEG